MPKQLTHGAAFFGKAFLGECDCLVNIHVVPLQDYPAGLIEKASGAQGDADRHSLRATGRKSSSGTTPIRHDGAHHRHVAVGPDPRPDPGDPESLVSIGTRQDCM